MLSSLIALVCVGFGLRAYRLSAEGLSEDELNKLLAVEDYRARGLTSTNGEHPMLMKALLTSSIVVAERWNRAGLIQANSSLQIAPESALRLPSAVFGALTALLIYLVVAELFGPLTGLIAAALWAFDPAAIGFNRIAKEDTFLLFFFLLANFFWLRGQRAAESGVAHPERYYWATAAAFGAMMASKYLPHLLAIGTSYYHIFQALPQTRWRLGKKKYLIFFLIMGAVFLACNPAILLPGTWHEMRIFAGERRIGHDGYEFMGRLYPNQMSLWLNGSPWYFYYAFMAFKLPLSVVFAFLVGLPLLFQKRLGDGRYFILFWMFYWFFPFSLMGGKFLRYFTLALPVVLITAAVGIHALAQWLTQVFGWIAGGDGRRKALAQLCVAAVFVFTSASAAISFAPYYRLYTNELGGGRTHAGDFFPHDEFYDGGVRETAIAVARLAPPGGRVASETPGLLSHYARLAGRDDLISISLSDRAALGGMREGDLLVVARGRRYFSNDELLKKLENISRPIVQTSLGELPATLVYQLDQASRRVVVELSR